MNANGSLGRVPSTCYRRAARRGFTLVELMIVVCIAGILLSILVPSFKRSREQAKLSACCSNLRAVFAAAQLYSVDNGGLYPFSGQNNPTPWINLATWDSNWPLLSPYVSLNNSNCPAVRRCYHIYFGNNAALVLHDWGDPPAHAWLLGPALSYPNYGISSGVTGLILKP